MDTGIESEKKESDKDKKKPKYKLMKTKFKNYLLNLISYILNNKNNFEEKLIQNFRHFITLNIKQK